MGNKQQSPSRKGIKYALWTISAYILLFILLTRLLHSSTNIFDFGSGIFYIVIILLPIAIGFVFLITGYSALKGDKTQILPAIVHGIVLAVLLTSAIWAWIFPSSKF